MSKRAEPVPDVKNKSKTDAGASGSGENTPTATEPTPAAPVARKPPGAKEVVLMEWKLVGTSAGTPVTLLKCVDRADAEAQMARLKAEGYYQDLCIYGVDAKVPLSSSLVKARKRVIESATTHIDSRKLADAKSASGGKSGKKGGPASKTPAGSMKSMTFVKTVKPTEPKVAKKATKKAAVKPKTKKAAKKVTKKAAAKTATKSTKKTTKKKKATAAKSTTKKTVKKAVKKAAKKAAKTAKTKKKAARKK